MIGNKGWAIKIQSEINKGVMSPNLSCLCPTISKQKKFNMKNNLSKKTSEYNWGVCKVFSGTTLGVLVGVALCITDGCFHTHLPFLKLYFIKFPKIEAH